MFPNFRVDVKHIIVDGDMLALHGYGVTDPGKIEVLGALSTRFILANPICFFPLPEKKSN